MVVDDPLSGGLDGMAGLCLVTCGRSACSELREPRVLLKL